MTLNTDATVVASFSGSSVGGGGGGTVPLLPKAINPLPKPKPRRLHCRPGFKKAQVHGKAKCVKKKTGRHHRASGRGSR